MTKTLFHALTVFFFLAGSSFTVAHADELISNGGFETGDSSSWMSFPSPSSTFIITGDANSGSFGAEMYNETDATAAIIKQVNLGEGMLSTGDTIDITFAAKGEGMVGGVVFAELFTEIAGGGVSSSQLLGGAPLGLTNTYQDFSFSPTLTADVSGGVSLQFVVVTGADPASTSLLMLDDVSVATEGLGTNFCVGATNSSGIGATMSASGSSSVAANDLELTAGPAPVGEFAVFFHGAGQGMIPFGEGFQCATGGIVRVWPPSPADALGNVTRLVDNTTAGGIGIVAGATRNFQCWYRDPAGGGSGFNLSDGLSVTFLP